MKWIFLILGLHWTIWKISPIYPESSEKQGYGPGLYLVRTYMERQGGSSECYNDNGFVVKLLVRVAG